MAAAQYYTSFRYAAELDREEPSQPWRQAITQMKALLLLCLLSTVLAIAYPLSFGEIFIRL